MAQAVDGHHLQVEGEGLLDFCLWGQRFRETVRVLDQLPDKVLIGRKFWRANSFGMDLSTNSGYIILDGEIFWTNRSDQRPSFSRVCSQNTRGRRC